MAIVDVRKLQQSIQGFRPTLPPMGTMVAQPPQMPMQPQMPQVMPLTPQQQLQQMLEPLIKQRNEQQAGVRAAEDQYQQTANDFGNLQHKPALSQSQAGIAAGIAALSALFGGKNGQMGQQAFANYEQGMQNKENQDFDNQGRKLQAMLQSSQFGLNRADQDLQGTTGQIQGINQQLEGYNQQDYKSQLEKQAWDRNRAATVEDRDTGYAHDFSKLAVSHGYAVDEAGVKADIEANGPLRMAQATYTGLLNGGMDEPTAREIAFAPLKSASLKNAETKAMTGYIGANTEGRKTDIAIDKAKELRDKAEFPLKIQKAMQDLNLGDAQLKKMNLEYKVLSDNIGPEKAGIFLDNKIKEMKLNGGDEIKADIQSYTNLAKQAYADVAALQKMIFEDPTNAGIEDLKAQLKVRGKDVGYYNKMLKEARAKRLPAMKQPTKNAPVSPFGNGMAPVPGKIIR